MRRNQSLDAVIVGAGPVGLAMALGLHQAGQAVALVIDREPSRFNAANEIDLRVYALAPDVLVLLDQLGLVAELRCQRTASYQHMVVWDAGSRARLQFAAHDYGWSELGLIVEHALLVDRLWSAIQTAGIEVHVHPQRLEWEVETEHWRLPALNRRTRLLLAADGADSALRAAAGISVQSEAYGQDALVAHVRFSQDHQHTAWQRFQPDGPLALLPLADGRVSIVWSQPAAAAARRLQLPEPAFLQELEQASESVLGAGLAVSARRTVPLRRLLAARYLHERLVLLGDAAHVAHPLAGQGLNLGLRDVALLLKLLQSVQSGERSQARALAAYQRERRSENTFAVAGIDLLDKLFRSTGPLAGLRGFGVNLVNRSAPLKAWFARLAAGRRERPLGP